MLMYFINKHLPILTLLLLSALIACSPKLRQKKAEKVLYPIDKNLPVDSEMLAFYKPYKLELDSVMNDIVAVSDIEITKAQPEGLLNNFFHL
ncbi:MAG: hypothetical protein EAZ51_09070 [Sphingobacteriales bacterium]|nr:MAG: hypothetical protein EAZ51_09070 [Sphingobacteriales bacterium]